MLNTTDTNISDLMGRISKLEHFLEGLLNPERYGWSVTKEVRDNARELLGIPRVEGGGNKERNA